MAITPEGTRKANPNWKKGFYYIAQGASLPIILVAIDYEKKCITAEKVIHPSGDIEKDMREIKLYYKDFKGKHPELFTIGNSSSKKQFALCISDCWFGQVNPAPTVKI